MITEVVCEEKDLCCVCVLPVCWKCCAGLLRAPLSVTAGTEEAAHTGEHKALTSVLGSGLPSLWAEDTANTLRFESTS